VDLTVGQPGEIHAGAGQLDIEIPVTLVAATDSGVQHFSGSYTLTASNNAGRLDAGWTIARAALAPMAQYQHLDCRRHDRIPIPGAINGGSQPSGRITCLTDAAHDTHMILPLPLGSLLKTRTVHARMTPYRLKEYPYA
jgi:hypothetical protein